MTHNSQTSMQSRRERKGKGAQIQAPQVISPFFFQKKLNFLWLFRVLGQEGGTLGGARVKRKGASVEDAQRHQRQEQCRRPPKKTRVEGRPPLFQTSSDMAGKQTVRKGTPIPQTSSSCFEGKFILLTFIEPQSFRSNAFI